MLHIDDNKPGLFPHHKNKWFRSIPTRNLKRKRLNKQFNGGCRQSSQWWKECLLLPIFVASKDNEWVEQVLTFT